MQTEQPTNNCTLCANIPASSFCFCSGAPVLFCEGCVHSHLKEFASRIHELAPVAALKHAEKPAYRAALKRRQEGAAVEALKSSLKDIERWKSEVEAFVDFLQRQVTAFRESVERELAVLKAETERAIEEGVQEFTRSIYEDDPDLTSPIAKALWTYKSGPLSLLSCQTNFAEVRLSAEAFLFSLNVQLQLDMPGFAPTGLIKRETEIDQSRRVNVYKPLTPEVCLACNFPQGQVFATAIVPPASFTPRVRRGPIMTTSGFLYEGEWSDKNQPDGLGKELGSNGMYVGEFSNKLFHGKGRYLWLDNSAYEGEFQFSRRHGFGQRWYPRGFRYTGQWEKNRWHGFGAYICETRGHSEAYFGEHKDNERVGRGVYMIGTEMIFAGEFRASKGYGRGVRWKHGKAEYIDLT